MSISLIHSNQDIIDLIQCEKFVLDQPKRQTIKNRNISQIFKAFSKDNKEFNIFITYSERMPQDFSIGLLYGGYLLLRCNGYHGTTRDKFLVGHHAYPHGHLLTIEDIKSGRAKKPSHILDYTGKYIDLRTATIFFFHECCINDEKDFFNLKQISFFDGGDSYGDSE